MSATATPATRNVADKLAQQGRRLLDKSTATPTTRYIVTGLMAGAVVFSLFFLMQHLIAISKTPLDEDELNRMLDFVRVPPEELVRPNKPKPKKPPPPDEPPPEPPPPAMDNVAPETQMQVSAAPVTTGINLDASGFGLSPGDGEYLPIVKVQPVYPERARARGIGGYVIVEFTVTRQGTTKDIRVVESEPSRIFDRAAMRAAAKFKYKPRIIDGNPIEVPGVQNKITFIMEE